MICIRNRNWLTYRRREIYRQVDRVLCPTNLTEEREEIMAAKKGKATEGGNGGELTVEEIKQCCEDTDCQQFVMQECNLPASSVQSAGDKTAIWNLLFTMMPQILDAFRKWRDQQG